MTQQNPKRGQTLIEFFVVAPVLALAACVTLGTLAQLVVREWIRVEAFALARAHLYGNDLERCALGSPALRALLASSKIVCGPVGRVAIAAVLREPFEASVVVDLTRGALTP